MKCCNNKNLVMLSILLVLSIICSSATLFAENEYIIRNTTNNIEYGCAKGRVIELGTEIPIPNAKINVKELGIEIFTDKNGEFSIDQLPIGEYTWEVIAKGYGKSVFESYPIGYLGATIFNFPLTKDQKGFYSKHSIQTESIPSDCEDKHKEHSNYENNRDSNKKTYSPNYAVPQDPPSIPSTLRVYYGGSVNNVGLEDYLKRVVSNEINPLNSLYQNMTYQQKLEMMKTQAVAARSYAVFHYYEGDRHSGTYDVCSAQHCQVYNPISTTEIGNAAVDATSGEILIKVTDFYNWIYQYADTVFFASCLKQTKSAETVWGSDVSYLQSVSCSYDIRPTLSSGHGVGLCQDGAAGYAKQNYVYNSILNHYYTGLTLRVGQQ